MFTLWDRQTPTYNTQPVIDGTLAAVRRGVEVTIYLDLGFNDAVYVSAVNHAHDHD